MKTAKETMQHLIELGACEEACQWAKGKTAAECWEQCERGDWLLWWAKKEGVGLRELTLAKGKCAETVIHLMKDQRSRDAVKAAIDFGEGRIGEQELKDAAAYVACAVDASADLYTSHANFAAFAATYASFSTSAAKDAADACAAIGQAREENQKKTADIVRATIKPMWI